MSTFTIVVLILAILVVLVALAIWLFLRWLRRRSSSARHRGGPRTVAELVEMRGTDGQDVPAEVVASAAAPAAEEAVAAPVAEPEEHATAASDEPVAGDAAADAPSTSLPSEKGADTPWARGARMTGDADDGKAEAWADVDPPAAPAPVDSTPSRTWVPRVIAGAVGAAGLGAVAARGRSADAADETAAQETEEPVARERPVSADEPAVTPEEPAGTGTGDGGSPEDAAEDAGEDPQETSGEEPAVAGTGGAGLPDDDAEDAAAAAGGHGTAEGQAADASAVEAAQETSGEEPAVAPEEPAVASTADAWLPDDNADDDAVAAGEHGTPEGQAEVAGFGAGADAPAAADRGGARGWLAGAAAGAAGLAAVVAHRRRAEDSADGTVSQDAPVDDEQPVVGRPTTPAAAADEVADRAVEADPDPDSSTAEESGAGAAAAGGLGVAGLAGGDDAESEVPVVDDVTAADSGDVVEADVVDSSVPVDASSAEEEPGGGVGVAAAATGAAAVGGLAVAGLAGRDDAPPAEDAADDVDAGVADADLAVEAAPAGTADEDVPAAGTVAGSAADVEVAEDAGADPGDEAVEQDGSAVDAESGGAGLAAAALGATAGGGLAAAGLAGRDGSDAGSVDRGDLDDGLTDDERAEHGAAAGEDGEDGEDRRPRRTPAEAEAEHAAVDVALLRTFGVAEAADRPGSAPIVSLSAAGAPAGPRAAEGPTVAVTVRVLGRDDDPVAGASTALVDDRGSQVATAVTGADGSAELPAPARAMYMVVASADRHQPGAVAVAVGDGPVEAAVPLVRSSSVAGSVWGTEEAIAGARVALLQDGETVEETESGGDGGFRIPDLTAGGYTLSVTAPEHDRWTVQLVVPLSTDVRHDVDLAPATLAHH